MKQRFEADKYPTYLYRFLDRILVRCPRCDRCAQIVLKESSANHKTAAYWTALVFALRRLVCGHCGYNKDWQGQTFAPRDVRDGYFNQPLWLQTSCCNETLWAYNEDHLSFLEEYVRAELREGGITGNTTLVSRLPRWLKSAKHRDEILKCIAKLRETL